MEVSVKLQNLTALAATLTVQMLFTGMIYSYVRVKLLLLLYMLAIIRRQT
jgi:hypothetical protein